MLNRIKWNLNIFLNVLQSYFKYKLLFSEIVSTTRLRIAQNYYLYLAFQSVYSNIEAIQHKLIFLRYNHKIMLDEHKLPN